jgi:hypothetical protein
MTSGGGLSITRQLAEKYCSGLYYSHDEKQGFALGG